MPSQTVFQDFVSSQTYWPPATQWSGVVTSFSMGAMKRGFGSHTAGGWVAVRQDGEISAVDLRAPSVVSHMSRFVYSSTARLPLCGSTMVSPPSPVNAC